MTENESMSEFSQTNCRPSICFISLDNFAALVDDPKFGHIGGAEIQQALIGRNLAKRGYRVSFITFDHGQDDEMEIDGIRIIKAYDQDVGIPVLRFLYPRLTSLWRAMSRADADIYYQRTGDSITGIAAAFCRRHHRKFVFAVASEVGCVVSLPYYTARHQRVFYRYGLRQANLVIAQTATQQRLLCENFGINSTVIPNCAPDYGRYEGGTDAVASNREKRLLWIGGFHPIKQPELLLDIAEQLPDLQFDVVGDGNNESEYVQRLRSRAKSIPNVYLHGAVPHAHVQPFFRRTSALICTSHAEGFPNIFLEAWCHGLPIVSTFDPDSVIVDHGLGIVAKDVSGLVAGIRKMMDLPEHRRIASRSAREYYLQNHTEEQIMERLESVFLELQNHSSH
jgi:glycosyltransferase involved in cell wall biosynthesis